MSRSGGEPSRSVSGWAALFRESLEAIRRRNDTVAFYGTPIHQQNSFSLQSTLSSSSSGTKAEGEAEIRPHHPITCSGALAYTEENELVCEHASTPPNDLRTDHCIRHSLVLLLLEPAVANADWKFKTREQLEYEWFEKHGEVWE